MADPDHVAQLMKGTAAWNAWRAENPKPAEPEPKRRQAFEQQPASAVPGSFG